MSWNAFPFLRRRRPARRVPYRQFPCRLLAEPLESRELLSVDLPVTAATYLSGPNADNGTAVDIAPDSTIIFAGQVDGNDFGLTPTDLLGGGPGAVIRFDATGTVPLSITRLPGIVRDMEVSQSDGDIAVIGDNYLAVLLPDASDLVWSTSTDANSNERVAIGADDTVAALVNKTVTTYDAGGNVLGQWTLGNTLVNDVAVDANSSSVFVAADDNKRLPSGGPVRVAALYSYDYGGGRQWTDYAWPGSTLTGNEADTNAVRVAMGRDGLLYLAGYSAGGNSMFHKDPHDLGTSAPDVQYDNYTQASNTASTNITYVARLNPADGSIRQGQFILTRLSNGKGNTIVPYAITADEYGRVYVGGSAAAYLADRADQTIAGQPVGPYHGDGFVLAIAPNFQAREVWTTWSGGPDGGGSRVNGIAAGNGIVAMAADVTAGEMITSNALQDTPGHDPSAAAPVAFLSAWPGLGPLGIVVDNDRNPGQVTFSQATWNTSTAQGGYWGGNFRNDQNSGKGLKWARFNPNLPVDGTYDVAIRYTSAPDRASDVPMDISHSDGQGGTTTDRVYVDQQVNGGQWVYLGTFAFTAGTDGNVTIRNDGTDGYVIADAVQFVLNAPTRGVGAPSRSDAIKDSGDSPLGALDRAFLQLRTNGGDARPQGTYWPGRMEVINLMAVGARTASGQGAEGSHPPVEGYGQRRSRRPVAERRARPGTEVLDATGAIEDSAAQQPATVIPK